MARSRENVSSGESPKEAAISCISRRTGFSFSWATASLLQRDNVPVQRRRAAVRALALYPSPSAATGRQGILRTSAAALAVYSECRLVRFRMLLSVWPTGALGTESETKLGAGTQACTSQAQSVLGG